MVGKAHDITSYMKEVREKKMYILNMATDITLKYNETVYLCASKFFLQSKIVNYYDTFLNILIYKSVTYGTRSILSL